MFACEAGVAIDFEPVTDLMSLQSADYAGNPALKLPILVTAEGPLYGSVNICRSIDAMAASGSAVRWPWQSEDRMAANAAELVQQAMATEVQIVVNRLSGIADDCPPQRKALTGMRQTLAWLETHSEHVLRGGARLDYIELALYCLITHIGFREVLVLPPLPKLDRWRGRIDRRESARATGYRFD